jgi:hypothetical protein
MENPLSNELRITTVSLLKKFIENAGSQEQFKRVYSIHSLLGVVLSEVPKLSMMAIELLGELLKLNKDNSLTSTKNRLRMIQFGIVLVLMQVSIKAKDEDLKKEAGEMIKNDFQVKEFEWNLKALERHLSTTYNNKDRGRFLPDIQSNKNTQSDKQANTKSKSQFPGREFINYLYYEYSKQQLDALQDQDTNSEKYFIFFEYSFLLTISKLQVIDLVEVRNKLRTITSQMMWIKEKQKKSFKTLSKKKIKDLNKDFETNIVPKNYTVKPGLSEYLNPVDKNTKLIQKVKSIYGLNRAPSKVQKIFEYWK